MKSTAIHWTSFSQYVDIDTGEMLTRYNARTNYITVKIKKHAKLNELKTRGTINYIHECRRQPQTKLSFD